MISKMELSRASRYSSICMMVWSKEEIKSRMGLFKADSRFSRKSTEYKPNKLLETSQGESITLSKYINYPKIQ